MDSAHLYRVKQQFILGAYNALIAMPLPDPNSPDYTPTLLYQARAHIALNDPASALKVLPSDSENVAFKAVSALARFVEAEEGSDMEAVLEELRDLSVEIESDDVDGTEKDKALVRVLAGTAFARAGETEEALETLGSETEDLEAVAVVVQIYLSIHRPDLAKKEFERSKRWAEDDLLLQLIESTICLITGSDSYSDPLSFYSEQIGNPSLSSPRLLTSRGVTRILRGEVDAAKSDLEESLQQQQDAETLAAFVVATGLSPSKMPEANELWTKFASEHASHPFVTDLAEKDALFTESVAKYTVPSLPVLA
ncbi:hypothetical protein BDZ89DRAFT_1109119 [Hymenopellis radicata]|nr:hypothetical protein BDZ89DRAFT_1109119 [Hymenopellis radicata]